jgi:SecD/SecF fusion protein
MDPKTSNNLIFFLGLLSLVLFVWYFATDKENRKMWVGTLLSVIVVSAGILWVKFMPLAKGIDLQGGVAYTVSVQANDGAPVTDEAVNAAKDILERRLSPLGNKDVVITPIKTTGDPKLYIEVPGITQEEADANRSIIEKTAKLDFRLLYEPGQGEPDPIATRGETEKVIMPGWMEVINQQALEPSLKDDDVEGKRKREEEKAATLKDFEERHKGKSAKEKADLQKSERETKAFKERKTVLVQKKPELSGKSVKRTIATLDPQNGGYMIAVELHGEYGDKMREITTTNLGKPFGIVIDGELISSPVIESAFGANFQITGNYSQQEAEEMANMLQNPLENPLRIDQVSSTAATYGDNLINQGMRAGLIGLAATFLFMAFYYRLAGVIAVIGLAINLLLLIAAMVIFEFTLTMPGIAGIILTLGIAIDANVLIYERMREEFLAGKNVDQALSASYSKAFTAIFDSNLTSLITSVIMIVVATGAIRGFGVTLTIGILASLFTALMITRVLFRWMVKMGLKKISFLSLVKNRYIDFLAKQKVSFMISLFLCIASIAILAVKGKDALGYELRGGDMVSIMGASEKEVKGVLANVKNAKGESVVANTQVVKPLGDAVASINVRANFEEGKAIKAAVLAALPNAKIGDVQSVGASVGGESFGKALWAIGLGLAGIFIYLVIRYETPFAIGGIVAIFHDVLISAGFCALCGKEIGMILIGAYLTIAGYSINDTIVIFDRIRDQLKSDTKSSLTQVMNQAISDTLSRTVITSGVTLLVVLSMLVLGGATLADFSLAMLVGMIVGTYSTIFVASPIVYWWAKKRGLNLAEDIQGRELMKSSIGSGYETEVNPNEVIPE